MSCSRGQYHWVKDLPGQTGAPGLDAATIYATTPSGEEKFYRQVLIYAVPELRRHYRGGEGMTDLEFLTKELWQSSKGRGYTVRMEYSQMAPAQPDGKRIDICSNKR